MMKVVPRPPVAGRTHKMGFGMRHSAQRHPGYGLDCRIHQPPVGCERGVRMVDCAHTASHLVLRQEARNLGHAAPAQPNWSADAVALAERESRRLPRVGATMAGGVRLIDRTASHTCSAGQG
jgi:hypothetical protein